MLLTTISMTSLTGIIRINHISSIQDESAARTAKKSRSLSMKTYRIIKSSFREGWGIHISQGLILMLPPTLLPVYMFSSFRSLLKGGKEKGKKKKRNKI